MPRDASTSAEKPREWRRKVQVSARMRSPAGWGDARIVNVSSRGMQIWTAQPAAPGTTIELRRGDQVIVARVVWQHGRRAGLRSDTVLPVTDLMCSSEKLGEPEPAWSPAAGSRRRSPRIDEAGIAYRARAMQFAAVVAVVGFAASWIGLVALETLGAPLRQMQQVLGG